MSVELSQKYQKKTDRQHILDNPDTYIGSVETTVSPVYLYDEVDNCILLKEIQYNPALYKLFDEGIVNCRDHVVRSRERGESPVTSIRVSFDKITGIIIMENNGDGIDVALHPEHNVYIPELIFGHLRTSRNYDKNEQKLTGGKNGFGFKLVLIWSKWGEIETVDATRSLKYKQKFINNLLTIEEPKIKACSKAPYTKVTFLPDYERLGISLEEMGENISALFNRRCFDISSNCGIDTRVWYNSVECKCRNFEDYISKYIGKLKRVHHIDENGRWEYAICMAPQQEFSQVSFVNGIYTVKGGKHVEYIIGQVLRKLVDYIEKKKKIRVAPASIKEQLLIFLRCDIINPSFDSQSKECCTTTYTNFGSQHTVPDTVIEKIAKLGVMDISCALQSAKETKTVAKKTDGIKTRLVKVDGLTDANWAGTTNNSHKCILILTEGKSAEAAVSSALSEGMRNIYGLFALKGKPMNVRGETATKIGSNEEITGIKKALGLVAGTEYTRDIVDKKLRYGKVLILTDADLDGHHIKALVLNLFHSEFPSITNVKDFLGFMVTPIIKAIHKKRKNELLFYSQGEYTTWLSSTTENEQSGYRIKYYKGLGTSTSVEFKEYFANNKLVFFNKVTDDDDSIDMVFNKKRAEERKGWIRSCNDRSAYLETSGIREVSYETFINKELVHFSKYDCERSIPNLVDGLKTSQRKILYCAFKRNLKEEIRVAQLAGYVSEHSMYHHGEASLTGAIVGMAQTFVGSNNIGLLSPNGQFGSRLHGGKDSASPRYIYTQLEEITRLIFPLEDDSILKYLEDDGVSIEPQYYIPIIPLVLINGSNGIGTGFSSFIPCYSTQEIINATLSLISNEEIAPLVPYYNGFKGTIEQNEKNPKKYDIKGKYTINKNIMEITELPVGTWTAKYKEWLDECTEVLGNTIKEYADLSANDDVRIIITFSKDLTGISTETIYSEMKLTSSVSTANMHLFDGNDVLEKYDTVEDILLAYAPIRIKAYGDRKQSQIQKIQQALMVASNKVRYIEANIDGSITLKHKTKNQIVELLQNQTFDLVDDSFDYLLNMTMLSVSVEQVDKLNENKLKLQNELDILMSKNEFDLWKHDLMLLKQYMTPIKKASKTKKL